MFRNLYAHEIELRVQQCKSNGCSVLLYKDARCDMAILDETVGAMSWKREHVRDNKNCIVSLWDDKKKQWVPKEDTGTESNTEQAKGLASDSFKRACFNWGIGRELYTSPFVWISLNGNEVDTYNGKTRLKFSVKFKVSEIIINENKQITKLVIVDQNNNIRFSTEKRDVPPINQNVEKIQDKFNGVDVNARTEIAKLLDSGKVPSKDKEEYINKLKTNPSLVSQKTVNEIKAKYFG